MRLFISIPLSENVRKVLADVKQDFPELPAKWVEKENLHITLVFIGEISEEGEVSEMSEILKALKHKPINLETDELSLLPNEKKAHILTVKLTGETEKLSTLAEEIKKGLREQKIDFDEKPFLPHITLARLKRLTSGERKELKEKVHSYILPEMEFRVQQVELIQSKLTPAGPVYKVLKHRVLCRE